FGTDLETRRNKALDCRNERVALDTVLIDRTGRALCHQVGAERPFRIVEARLAKAEIADVIVEAGAAGIERHLAAHTDAPPQPLQVAVANFAEGEDAVARVVAAAKLESAGRFLGDVDGNVGGGIIRGAFQRTYGHTAEQAQPVDVALPAQQLV